MARLSPGGTATGTKIRWSPGSDTGDATTTPLGSMAFGGSLGGFSARSVTTLRPDDAGEMEEREVYWQCTVDRVPIDPLLSYSPNYSFPRTKRFPGTKHNGELDCLEVQRRTNPGPGAYFKSEPRGHHFCVDEGRTVVMGANHVCPWKKNLGHNINPVLVDGVTVQSQPTWTTPKLIRHASHVVLKQKRQDAGHIRCHPGTISPGPVYDHHSSFNASTRCAAGKIIGFQRPPRRSLSMPRIRMVPAPEPKVAEEEDEEGLEGGEPIPA